MKQVYNPFLPLNEYIPDGEPHVFGDRVYLFGSHDRENGDTFCMLDYEFWSAPIENLSDWTSKGINYSARQDPLYGETMKYMYAPTACGAMMGGTIFTIACPVSVAMEATLIL